MKHSVQKQKNKEKASGCRLLGRVSVVFFFLLWGGGEAARGQEIPVPPPLVAGGPSGGWLSLEAFERRQEEVEKEAVKAALQPVTAPSPPEKKEILPDRPLSLPNMPTVSVVYDPVRESPEGTDFLPSLEEQKKWMTLSEAQAEEVRKEQAQRLYREWGETMAVRLAWLPSLSIRSVPAKRITQPIMDREVKETRSKKEKTEEVVKGGSKEKQKEQNCEALTDLRRRQLEAIESDRRTLSALKDALAELGLTKELGFMAKGTNVEISGANMSMSPSPETQREDAGASATHTP